MSALVGIDVCKACLDVAVLGETGTEQFPNSAEGFRRLISWLGPRRPQRVLLEATGGYEVAVLDALHAAGVPVVRVNPRQARDFAKGLGQLAKTDVLDAQMLARMAATIEGPLYMPREPWRHRLAQCQQRRAQVLEMLLAERARVARFDDSELIRATRRHVRFLEGELRKVDGTIGELLEDRAELAPLRTLRGVGPVLQATLACLLPELGRLDGKAIAKLVGVAPLARDSGQMRGRRTVWGGRAAIRTALYMSALTSMRFEPALREFYQRLRSRGKAGKVAIVAVMRKMLVILNARMRDALRSAEPSTV